MKAILRWAGLTALASTAAMVSAARGEPADPSTIIYTRQTTFVVPFRVTAAAESGHQPTAVELHVSGDQGATWGLQATVSPRARGFKYLAPADGEYWFAIRTRHDDGQARPDAPFAAELRVMVDTVPPTLDLAAKCGNEGEIDAQLRISDLHLRPESLRLEFRPNGQPDAWETVAIDPIPADAPGPEHYGEVRWWPQTPDAGFTVRASISDAAGNPSVTQIQVASVVAPSRRDEATVAVQPAAADSSEDAAPVRSRPAAWPADEVSDEPLGHRTDADDPTSAISTDVEPTHAPIQPAVGREVARPDAGTAAGLPLGVRPQMVNSKHFQLDYDVESVGPWGVRRVELWGTSDGGATWTHYGVDTDNQSPLTATVEGEGTYGFRILVQSGSGLVESPPQAGEAPEMWIGVDLTPPACRITEVEQGSGERAGQVLIHWQADDASLAERPVSLAFSQRQGGPWLPIAAGLRNTGRYVWQLDSRVPDQLYLHLEVRDEAGNFTAFDTAEPVLVNALRPRGRIREVRPVTEP
jgi:hypothetical protein